MDSIRSALASNVFNLCLSLLPFALLLLASPRVRVAFADLPYALAAGCARLAPFRRAAQQNEGDGEAARLRARDARAKMLSSLPPPEPSQAKPKVLQKPIGVDESEDEDEVATAQPTQGAPAAARSRLLETYVASAKSNDVVSSSVVAPDGIRRRKLVRPPSLDDGESESESAAVPAPPTGSKQSRLLQQVSMPAPGSMQPLRNAATPTPVQTVAPPPWPATPVLPSSVLTASQRNAGLLLMKAAERGDLAMVKKWQAHGAAVGEAADDDGATAMHAAAATGRVEVLRYLVEAAGADGLTSGSPSLLPPLHLACLLGQPAIVTELLQLSTDAAAAASQPAVIAGSGADVVQAWCGGAAQWPASGVSWTPLALAAVCGDVDIISALLTAGADVSVCCGPLSAPPAVYAAAWGWPDAVAILVDVCPSVCDTVYRAPSYPSGMGVTVASAATSAQPVPLNDELDGEGAVPSASVREAALTRAASMFGSALLRRKWAGVREGGDAPCLFRRVSASDRQAVIALVFARGTSIDAPLMPAGSEPARQRRALHLAAEAGDAATVTFLLDATQADPDDPTLMQTVARALRLCAMHRQASYAGYGGEYASRHRLAWQAACGVVRMPALVAMGRRLIDARAPLRQMPQKVGDGAQPVPAIASLLGLRPSPEADPGEAEAGGAGAAGAGAPGATVPADGTQPETGELRKALTAWTMASQRR